MHFPALRSAHRPSGLPQASAKEGVLVAHAAAWEEHAQHLERGRGADAEELRAAEQRLVDARRVPLAGRNPRREAGERWT